MRVEYLTYRCPTCTRKANIPTTVTREPLRCSICDVIICNSCGDFSFCPNCRTLIQPHEYSQLRELNSKSNKSNCLTAGSCCFILCFPMVLMGGLFMGDITWISVAVGGILIGIGSFLFISRKSDKKNKDFFTTRNAIIPVLKQRRNSNFAANVNSIPNYQNLQSPSGGNNPSTFNLLSGKTCPACYAKVDHTNAFCTECGKKLNS